MKMNKLLLGLFLVFSINTIAATEEKKEEKFQPNGYFFADYRYYGDAEGQNHDFNPTLSRDGENDGWSSTNNYSRTQFIGKVNMAEKHSLEWRIRSYSDLDKEEDRKNSLTNGTEVRLRYLYDHGNLGNTKINFTSRYHYKKLVNDDQELQYMARFQLKDYMFDNDFIKIVHFVLAPKYMYVWDKDNSSDYENKIGLDLYSFSLLPFGFTLEFNVYTDYRFYGQDQFYDGATVVKDRNMTAVLEAYLRKNIKVYEKDKFSINLGFEGGSDPSVWSKEKDMGEPVNNRIDGEYQNKKKGTDNCQISLYALPYVQFDYRVNENYVMYAAVGAEYRDFGINNKHSASNWRWQPTAWAGFRFNF